MKILTSSICKIGGRDYNQDFLLSRVHESGACFVVCDGLGSYAGSEVASRLCATKIVSDFNEVYLRDPSLACSPQMCGEYVRIAHNYVKWHKTKNPQISSSCTTVAFLTTDYNKVVVTHIGDTRVYYFKSGKLVHQTRDHSLSQIAVDQGVILQKDIRTHKDQNKLTRVLGSFSPAHADISVLPFPLSRGDSIIICSDGLWEYVLPGEMEADLNSSANPAQALTKLEKRLLKRAEKSNDNYSAIVAMVVD